MNSNTSTIGLDLGDRRHHACVLDKTGEILAEEAIANSREVLSAFARFFRKRRSSWKPARTAVGLGHPVLVANARKVRPISGTAD